MQRKPQFCVPVVTSCPLRARIKIEFPFSLMMGRHVATHVSASHARKGQLVTTNGMPRAEIEQRWKAGEFPDLHTGLAQFAMTQAGIGNANQHERNEHD